MAQWVQVSEARMREVLRAHMAGAKGTREGFRYYSNANNTAVARKEIATGVCYVRKQEATAQETAPAALSATDGHEAGTAAQEYAQYYAAATSGLTALQNFMARMNIKPADITWADVHRVRVIAETLAMIAGHYEL